MADAVCPSVEDMPHIDDGPYKTIALILTISVPILFAVQYAAFLRYRRFSVYLRKRSLLFVTQFFVGAYMTWGYTALYDYIGSDEYPCWLFQLLNYFATPIMASSIFLQTAVYISEIAALRLRQKLMERDDDFSKEGLRRIDGKGHSNRFGCLSLLAAHLRVSFRVKPSRDGYLKDRILNIEFVRTWFISFWSAVAFVPFTIAFFARLGTDQQWQKCNGCELSQFDAGFALAIFVLGALSGELANSSKVLSVDSLRIVREAKVSWRVGYIPIITFSLYLADPGQIYANHVFNWRITFLLAVILLSYIKTTHQIVMARSLQNQVLTSSFIAREERFADVMSNKELKQRFYLHLDSELSFEIYRFMDDVEELRSNWEKEKDTRQIRAREMFDTYIQRRSPMEINISYLVRERLLGIFQIGNVQVTCFDEAYGEIRGQLLSDAFPRFLAKLGREAEEVRSSKSRRPSSNHTSPKTTDLTSHQPHQATSELSLVSHPNSEDAA